MNATLDPFYFIQAAVVKNIRRFGRPGGNGAFSWSGEESMTGVGEGTWGMEEGVDVVIGQ